MKIKNLKQFLFGVAMAGIFYTSCSKNDDHERKDTGFSHGVFIINEGAFQANNGSISYFNTDSNKIINNIFETVNGRSLGDIVQSFGIAGDYGFIVVNNSQKIEVVNLKSFQSVGVITGISYPRYFLSVSDTKGYLTNGSFAGYVYVIDVINFTKTDSISVGNGPENLVKSGNFVFVANSGGWDTDNTVSVIDINLDEVVDTIEVGDSPTDLVVDADANIWVLCKGNVVYDWNPPYGIQSETESSLVKLNYSTGTVELTLTIGQMGDYFNPQRLAISNDGQTIYFNEAGGVYSMSIYDINAPTSVLIPNIFYGLEVDPYEGYIYGFFLRGFDANGYMLRYTASGNLVDSMEVGIAPNGAIFN